MVQSLPEQANRLLRLSALAREKPLLQTNSPVAENPRFFISFMRIGLNLQGIFYYKKALRYFRPMWPLFYKHAKGCSTMAPSVKTMS